MLARIQIVVGTGENEDLPPGWKKEIKLRKGSGTKYDKVFYPNYFLHLFTMIQYS